MSPELTLRPSLSAAQTIQVSSEVACVAGANAPAFVERSATSSITPARSRVAGANAPAFVERAWWPTARSRKIQVVSPELTLRPSLSGACPPRPQHRPRRVAGANAPAFVERWTTRTTPSMRSSVAGANAPAFVERSCSPTPSTPGRRVAGANAPAFVERTAGLRRVSWDTMCRRS